MTSVAEIVSHLEAEQQKRSAKRERRDKYARFYASKAWRVASYRFKVSQPKPLRCWCCGISSREATLVTDHKVPLKTEIGWSRRLDPTNYQILCSSDNLAKASSDQTDWRDP
jgi:5-methylcytosine-specific restriction endonuclease McrA